MEGRTGRTGHVVTLMDVCHLKISELEQKFQKYKERVEGVIVKDDSGSYAVNYGARFVSVTHDDGKSCGWYCKATSMHRTSS